MESLINFDEAYRQSVLNDLCLLDTDPEPAFDALLAVACKAIGVPIGLVSLIDTDRQWFKARYGLDVCETSRSSAFCDHAIRSPDMMVVENAWLDPRFANNPLVIGPPNVCFYAGVPLLVRSHSTGKSTPIGTLCIIDHEPRSLTPDNIDTLHNLAQVVVALIEARQRAMDAVDYARRHQEAAHQLYYERRKFQQAERMAGLGYWRMRLSDEELYWSDQVYKIHGLPVVAAPPLNAAFDYYPPHARAEISAAVAKTIETGVPYDLETDFMTAQGMLRRVRSIGELEVTDDVPVAIFGVFQDVTERYRLEQTLRRTAHMDALTGVANRAAFDEKLDERIVLALENGCGLVVMLIDLDGFKAVNDSQGHMAGDELLQAIAMRFKGEAYADCFVARLGGDEFVLIPDEVPNAAFLERFVRRVLDDLSRPVETVECDATISGTIGIAHFRENDTRRDLMRRADQALYAAKNSERGTARIYDTGRVIRLGARSEARKAG